MSQLLAMTFVGLALGGLVFSPCVAHDSSERDGLFRAGDRIEIKLSGAPQQESAIVSNTYLIDDGGDVNLPYIGKLHAKGLRSFQLQRVIEKAYKVGEIFTHPAASVSFSKGQGVAPVVYVNGEVMTPKPVVKFITLTRAGITRKLDIRKVDNPDASLLLQPGDIIHVPR